MESQGPFTGHESDSGSRRLTFQDLRNKRLEMKLLCRVKTSVAQMRDIREKFLAQEDLSYEEKVEADLQLAKLLSYLGDSNEAQELIGKHLEAAKQSKSKIHAKVRYLYGLEHKKVLVFNICKKETDSFLADYADAESYAWKYLYKTLVIQAKLFQLMNALEQSEKLLQKAKEIIDRNEPGEDSRHHGILLRVQGYQYWKFFKKQKAQEYLNRALAIFQKLNDPYLISTIHKEKGDMHRELQEAEQAQEAYEECIRLRKIAFGDSPKYPTEKIYFRLAENMMKERANEEKLQRAHAYMDIDIKLLREIHEIQDLAEEDTSKSLYLAMHYQFRGKLFARSLDKEAALEMYKKSEGFYLRANNGKPSLVMQCFFQYYIDDLAELGFEEEALKYNKIYKKTLQSYYERDDLFYIAYTVDIVAQEMQTKPMKAFYKVKRAQAVIEPIIGKDSLLGMIFQLFEGLKELFDPQTANKGLKNLLYVEDKLFKFFEGDARNPYFEAVYVSLYHYYNQQMETSYTHSDDSGETRRHLARKQAFYLEKCLAVQLLQYGKFHSSVLQTYQGLAESYHILQEKPKCLYSLQQSIEIKNKIGTKDELFDIMTQLKIIMNEEVVNLDESIKKMDALCVQFEAAVKIPAPQRRQYIININNHKKNTLYHHGKKQEALKVLEEQLKITEQLEVQYQMSHINIHQDMAMILTELDRYDDAVHHADIMLELVKKNLNKNHNASGIYQHGFQIRENAIKLKELKGMNPVKRFKTKNPTAFYAIIVAGVVGTAFALMKKYQ